ncbi:MAG: D-2-hydroxyacid dehydrogenase [Rhodospirillales bacterium]|nr:D-2-hydroxyacid dehydrogenase [Rhodospirillales bacterium]
MTVKAHLVAFNANEYCDLLAPMFPEVKFTYDLGGKNTSDAAFECEILIGFGVELNGKIFERNKNIRWVQGLGTGMDGINNRTELSADTITTSMRGIHGPQMTDMAFLLMLSFNRNFPKILDNQRSHKWQRWPGLILQSKTVAILGMGIIGGELAKKCKAFGMKIIGFSRTPRGADDYDQVFSYDDLAANIGAADYVVVLTPYTPGSKHLVGADVLAAMKPSAFIINLARGSVIDDAALIDALAEKSIAGAWLDVFAAEPLAEGSPLWDMENVIITPHMGGMSEDYVAQAMQVIEVNMRAFLDGREGDMINRVERI